jgi:tetratricopeptide (TPR) repeat protein
MNKENFLFGTIGLLLGLIIGFLFTNQINKSAMMPGGAMMPASQANSALPPGHPDLADGQTAPSGAAMPEVQAAIDNAKKKPNDFEAQVKVAELYYGIQNYDRAIEYLKKANQINPAAYEIVVNLGNANFDSGNFTEAEKWYLKALEKKPEDVNVRTDLGLTFIFRDTPNYDRAIQEFTRSLETDPNHIQTLQNLTVAYTKKGDAAKANVTLERLETADPTNKAIPQLRADIGKISGS